jgi:hypothetical protein
MHNYPSNFNSTSMNQYGMVPLGYHNLYPSAGYNYGNMNIMSTGGMYNQIDGNYLYNPNPNNLNSMNIIKKNNPFDLN